MIKVTDTFPGNGIGVIQVVESINNEGYDARHESRQAILIGGSDEAGSAKALDKFLDSRSGPTRTTAPRPSARNTASARRNARSTSSPSERSRRLRPPALRRLRPSPQLRWPAQRHTMTHKTRARRLHGIPCWAAVLAAAVLLTATTAPAQTKIGKAKSVGTVLTTSDGRILVFCGLESYYAPTPCTSPPTPLARRGISRCAWAASGRRSWARTTRCTSPLMTARSTCWMPS